MLQTFVVEPQPNLAPILKSQTAARVVGTANTLGTLTSRPIPADLVLISASLPHAEILRFIRQRHTTEPSLVIADVEESREQVLPFLEAGAAGYVPRDMPAKEMVLTLCAIHSGKPPLAPEIGTALVERMHELLARREQHASETMIDNLPSLDTLTLREREILLLIRDGASNQEIARQFMIELGTVKNHVHNILKKLNVSRRDQAASYLDLLEQMA